MFKRCSKYYTYDDFHFHKKCFYLFSIMTSEDWVSRTKIKEIVRKLLENDKNFAEKIKKLQIAEKKKKKGSIEKVESVFFIQVVFSTSYLLKNSAILDSGSTIHVFNKIIRFLNFWTARPGDFLWAGDHKVPIQGYGDVDIEIQNSDAPQDGLLVG